MQRSCKFGTKCWNKTQCKYFHPKNDQNLQKYCRFGSKCRYLPNCSFYHPNLEKLQQRNDQQIENYVNFDCYLEIKSQPGLNLFQKNIVRQKNQSSQVLTVQTKTENQIFNIQNQIKNGQKKFNANRKDMGIIDKIEQNQSKSSQLNPLNLIHTGQQQYLERVLQEFFNVRLVKNNIFDIIYAIISEHFSLEQVSTVISFIEKLEESKLAAQFTYLKIIKTIARKGLDYQAICEQLQKQQKIKLLKEQKYAKFIQQIPNFIKYNVLTDSELMQYQEQIYKQKNCKRLKFLIDGQNVINTHKILRKYYRNKDKCIEIQGQIRVRWLVSEQQESILFFDYSKGPQQKYWEIADKIMYKEEMEKIKLQKCIFANQFNQKQDLFNQDQQKQNQKQEQSQQQNSETQNQNLQLNQYFQNKNTADKCIIQWISQNLNQKKQNIQTHPLSQTIILISADRILIQKCLQIQPELKISSGKFFIKYCKEHIRRKYYGNKNKKAVIKRIFIQPRIQS